MIFAVIPVKRFENSKSRLAPLFSLQERITLSGLMLEDTLRTLTSSRCFERILVVTGDQRAKRICASHGVSVVWQDRDTGVNSAVSLGDSYCIKDGAAATVVLPQDLPLIRGKDIAKVCAAPDEPCIAICPSLRLDGTNVLLRKPPRSIATYYDNNSYLNHIKAAKSAGISVKFIKSKNLMFDIDTPTDIIDLTRMPDEMISAKSSTSFIRKLVSDRSM